MDGLEVELVLLGRPSLSKRSTSASMIERSDFGGIDLPTDQRTFFDLKQFHIQDAGIKLLESARSDAIDGAPCVVNVIFGHFAAKSFCANICV